MSGFVIERIESRQRRLDALPGCCLDEVARRTGAGDPSLLAGIECPTCATMWLNIAPRAWVMESELMLAQTPRLEVHR